MKGLLLALSVLEAAALVIPMTSSGAATTRASQISMMSYGERFRTRGGTRAQNMLLLVSCRSLVAAEYMASRGMATTLPLAEYTSTPAPMTTYEEYRKSRGVVPTPTAPAPQAISEYEAYMARRALSATTPTPPATPLYDPLLQLGFAEEAAEPASVAPAPITQDPEYGVCTFIVDGVPKKYRIMM